MKKEAKTFQYLRLAAAISAVAEALMGDSAAPVRTELRHLIAATAGGTAGEAAAQASAALRAHLPAMLARGFPAPLTPIGPALAAVWEHLDWHYSYPDRGDAPALGTLIAFAEVIGPAGPVHAPDIRVGFTFMAPDVLYPAHAHPAVELYVVLSGRALWTRSSVKEWQDPGDAIVHASEEPHVMQTFDEPLLALYSWRGDIFEPPRYT